MPVNGTQATKKCLMGGTDIDSGGTYRDFLAPAVQSGELDVKFARLGLKNSYKMRMMMGLFDPTVDNEYKHIPTAVVGSPEHQAMSLLGAKKGMVLLKKGPLPFAKGKRIAVIGGAAFNTGDMTGNYDGPLCPNGGSSCFPNILQAINATNTLAGGATIKYDGHDAAEAAAAAKSAEQVVMVIDNARDGGGEGQDRYTIHLSADQLAVAQVAHTNTPTHTHPSRLGWLGALPGGSRSSLVHSVPAPPPLAHGGSPHPCLPRPLRLITVRGGLPYLALPCRR